MKTEIIITFFALFAVTHCAISQQHNGIAIDVIMHYGRIIKHTPKLTYDITENSVGFEANFKIKTFGKKPWHELQKYPVFGLSLGYYRFGDHELLGEAIALMPNLNVPLFRHKRLDFHFQFGTGIAYLRRKFDNISNPEHNSIGSHINNITGFKFHLGYTLHPHWKLLGGISLTHYSNGAFQLPNLGINVLAFDLGIQFIPQPLEEADFIHLGTSPKPDHRLGASAYFAMAFRESQIPGGPKYPLYIASLAATYSISRVNRLSLGMEYEFNRSVYYFGLHTFDFNNEAEARGGATRIMIFVADEFLFGNWGITLQAGTYISASSAFLPFFLYNRLITRYYFPSIGKTPLKLHIGIILKSHKAVAEYIALGIGASF